MEAKHTHRPPVARTDIAAEILELVALRAAKVDDGMRLAEPSAYWIDFIDKFQYVFELGETSLELLRYHTYHLTSDNYQRYYFGSKQDQENLANKYNALSGAVGSNHLLEPPQGIGYPLAGGLVSWDLLRYMSVLCDLIDADVAKERTNIIEIGGGYGGLCRVVLGRNPACVYSIVDLEEVLFFSKCYLDAMLPQYEVKLVRSPNELSFHSHRINLIPQCLLEEIDGRFDLAINHQSMQEMEAAQVQRYLGFIASHCAKFYSRNLKRHEVRIALEKGLSIDVHSQIFEYFPDIHWKGEATRPEADLLDEHLLRLVVAPHDSAAGLGKPAAGLSSRVPSEARQLEAHQVHCGEMLQVVPLQAGSEFSVEVRVDCQALTLLVATWSTIVERLELEVIVKRNNALIGRLAFTCLDVHDWQELAFDLRGVQSFGESCTIEFVVAKLSGDGKLGIPLFQSASSATLPPCTFSSDLHTGGLVHGGHLFMRA